MAQRLSPTGHLPNLGGDSGPGPPDELPRQRRGTTPQMRGRYPDYDVLASAQHWDPVTRAVVLERVANVPPIRFFTPAEERTLRAFADVALGQDCEPKVPALEMVDAKFFEGRLDGYHYEDLPTDDQTWRQVAAHLDESAREDGAEDFASAGSERQHEIVERFSKGELDWNELPVKRAWTVVMRGLLEAFYSHPWAWNEIGFGGPAYPRGFARLSPGQRETWERAPEFAADPVSDTQGRGLE